MKALLKLIDRKLLKIQLKDTNNFKDKYLPHIFHKYVWEMTCCHFFDDKHPFSEYDSHYYFEINFINKTRIYAYSRSNDMDDEKFGLYINDVDKKEFEVKIEFHKDKYKITSQTLKLLDSLGLERNNINKIMLAILIINLYSTINSFDSDYYDVEPFNISKINKYKNNTIEYSDKKKTREIKFNYIE
ncbi:hypothetical protein QJ850_gp083 [Acanthamoeba polyphaga mimivirus]|uniref:Uncharacterized protein n=1 Tax=Acanthamoeba polyphaga mimivirus Kroon TaxID=3069720 RepID=A0A0G2YC43_9VIRU|nr:hypothetical protein QJ850_gp083 [Acanthamoeba polyphaga mimivirus]AKI80616.1 hypothetical protein [Acanthamoeba polyphaga mimivirus Kroon]